MKVWQRKRLSAPSQAYKSDLKVNFVSKNSLTRKLNLMMGAKISHLRTHQVQSSLEWEYLSSWPWGRVGGKFSNIVVYLLQGFCCHLRCGLTVHMVFTFHIVFTGSSILLSWPLTPAQLLCASRARCTVCQARTRTFPQCSVLIMDNRSQSRAQRWGSLTWSPGPTQETELRPGALCVWSLTQHSEKEEWAAEGEFWWQQLPVIRPRVPDRRLWAASPSWDDECDWGTGLETRRGSPGVRAGHYNAVTRLTRLRPGLRAGPGLVASAPSLGAQSSVSPPPSPTQITTSWLRLN